MKGEEFEAKVVILEFILMESPIYKSVAKYVLCFI